jgi:hypothetical protein
MKSALCLLTLAALLCGCNKTAAPDASASPRWEYKTVTVKNFAGVMKDVAYQEMLTNAPDWQKHERSADSGSGDFHLDSGGQMGEYGADLRQLGSDGWELVSAVPQIETVADAESFHGQDYDAASSSLKDGYTHFSNVRTGQIILIFKRPAR